VSVIHTDYIPPDVPTGLSATPVINGDALNISWFPNNDDTEIYSIYTNRTGGWELLVNISHPTTNYIDNSELVNGTRYYYMISAWDEVPQESSLSDVVNTIHIDQKSPKAPNGLEVINVSGNSIELSWSPNTESDLVGYIIYINVSGVRTGGPYINLTTVNASTTRYIIENLTEETTYYFALKAFDEVPLFSEFSKEVSNTTLDATPPGAPMVAPLPEFTNDTELIVHGDTEPNASVRLLRNDVLAGEGIAGIAGEFNIAITLFDGENVIIAYSIDISGNQGPNTPAQTVILDTVEPFADAGEDIIEQKGTMVEFNASGSYDVDSGLNNYTWRFDYDNKTYKLYGELAKFKFDIAGNYSVSLRVFDLAGNWHEDFVKVIISEGLIDRLPPIVDLDNLYPPVDGTDIEVKLTIRIPFDEHVNISSFYINLSALLVPEDENSSDETGSNGVYDVITGSTSYDEKNMTVIFKPQRALLYNQTYSANFTIADLVGNGMVFGWSFTTREVPLIPPDTNPPEIDNVEFIKQNNRLKIGDQITIPFNEALNESTIDLVITDSEGNEVAGTFVYDEETNTIVFTPDQQLKYDEKYTVSIKVNDTSGNPLVPEDGIIVFTTEEKESEVVLSESLMYLMLAVMIIVIILIIVLLAMRSRTKPIEEPSDIEDEDEDTEE
jgi:hypothetical protein